jgi:hypothetical protein
VRGYQFGDDLVCDDVFPVSAGGGTVGEHRPGRVEVSFGSFKEKFDLCMVSDCRILSASWICTEWCLSDSAVSVAEAMISAMGGNGPTASLESPEPSLLLHPSAPTPCAPLV